jgi:hypothetical protein
VAAVVFSSGWTSGVNAYMTVLQLGLLGRFLDADAVPDASCAPTCSIAAAVMYLIEFVTGQDPVRRQRLGHVHTIIRPAIGLRSVSSSRGRRHADASARGATGGATAFASHVVKSSARLVVNMSPEPVTNITVSVGEDVTVGALVAVVVVAPWVAAAITGVLLVLGVLMVWAIQQRSRSARGVRPPPPRAATDRVSLATRRNGSTDRDPARSVRGRPGRLAR